ANYPVASAKALFERDRLRCRLKRWRPKAARRERRQARQPRGARSRRRPRPRQKKLILVVIRDGHPGRIILGAALEAQEVVVAAAPGTRIRSAYAGTALVDRTAALSGIEEAADFTEVLVLLAPQKVLVPVRALGEALLC